MLKNRHVLMIALGSAIGTGFFFSTGQSIALTGPSILLAYIIGGLVMYTVIRALGEMSVAEPNIGSFSHYAYKYLNSYMGFISGWNYWFNYIIVCMLELTASGIFLSYWLPNMLHWPMMLAILMFFTVINLFNVRFFGESEFWFSGIKVITIVAMILFGLYLISINTISHDTNTMMQISNLWSNGFFANGAYGFLCSFVIVVFAFGGTELVGITAGETINPSKTIPLAINSIIIRITLFYVATILIILCLYPWSKIATNISPFVDVFSKIGIKKAANLINLVAITAALSSFNSGIYGTTRMLYNLSIHQHAPHFLSKLAQNGVAYYAVLCSSISVALVVLLNYFYDQHIFSILLALATIAAIINWLMILLTHRFFRQKNHSIRHYYALYYPVSSIIAAVILLFIVIMIWFIPDMRLSLIIAPIWLFVLSIGYWIINTKDKHESAA